MERPAAEVAAFGRVLSAKLAAAYAWPLWGAAYVINGGCSDDGFEYFRAWRVAQGQTVYDAAVAEPDSLAKVVDPDEGDGYECEDLSGVALRAYEEVAGEEMPPSAGGGDSPGEPSGARWDFDDPAETANRLPKLSRRYGEAGD